MAKKREGLFIYIAAVSIICIYLFVFGLYESIFILEEWRYTPNYFTDASVSLFSGFIFCALGIITGIIANQCAKKSLLRRRGFQVAIVLFLLFPLWSIALTCMRFSTAHRYATHPQFGLCLSHYSHGTTNIYVSNTYWCHVFGYEIKRSAPGKTQ